MREPSDTSCECCDRSALWELFMKLRTLLIVQNVYFDFTKDKKIFLFCIGKPIENLVFHIIFHLFKDTYTQNYHNVLIKTHSFWGVGTGFLCVALFALELILHTRLASNSKFHLPLPPT